MTVQLIHFYWLCLGMEIWSVLLMCWKLRVHTRPWGVCIQLCVGAPAYTKEIVKSKGT